jgi:DNA polymerase sigma
MYGLCSYEKRLVGPLASLVPSVSVPLQIDITLINTDYQNQTDFPLYNSRLLKCYSKINPKIKIIGTLVKRWITLESINKTNSGYISSYTFMLLVIHFF